MLSLFSRSPRKHRRKKSKGRVRVSRLVATSVLTTAVLLPVASYLTDGSEDPSADTTASSTSNQFALGGPATHYLGDGAWYVSGQNSGGSESSASSLAGFVLAVDEEPDDSSGDATSLDPSQGEATGDASLEGPNGADSPWVDGSAFDEMPGVPLVRVEEDWQLVVSGPDVDICAPQLGTVMTPFSSAAGFHLTFAINHRSNQGFQPGGMELQVWYQGVLLGSTSTGDSVLNTDNEEIRWTQKLELRNHRLWFSIVDGQSSTWGTFGQGESMHLSIATTLPDLNEYHPSISVQHSGVVFASNRVRSLVLKAVRGYSADGECVLEDLTPVIVFEHSE